MRAGDHDRAHLLGREDRAQGKAAADALGDHHHVGAHARPFMGEEPARAPHPALHLVEDHEDPRLVAEVAQALQAGVGKGPDAALALHGLDHDGAHVRLAQGLLQCFVVAPGQLREAG